MFSNFPEDAQLLELRQRNEKKLADGTLKMQDLVKTAASRLMI
jgi:hypothetical protein